MGITVILVTRPPRAHTHTHTHTQTQTYTRTSERARQCLLDKAGQFHEHFCMSLSATFSFFKARNPHGVYEYAYVRLNAACTNDENQSIFLLSCKRGISQMLRD